MSRWTSWLPGTEAEGGLGCHPGKSVRFSWLRPLHAVTLLASLWGLRQPDNAAAQSRNTRSSPSPDQAGSGAVYGADESASARAVTLYRQLCVRCHGGDGQGRARKRGAPPDFTNHGWQSRHTDVQLIVSVRDGKGSRMPSFSDRLNRAETAALVAFIRRFDSEHRDADTADDFETRFHALEAQWERLHQDFLRLNSQTRGPR